MNRYHKAMDGVLATDGAWVLYEDIKPLGDLAQELIIESIRLRTGPPGPWNPIRADAYRECAGKIQKILAVSRPSSGEPRKP